ncbi:MAG: SDR family NAD(P)-dependent oxidoreductase [Bacilli bacterium]|jgi:short-subunit dehydrogenase
MKYALIVGAYSGLAQSVIDSLKDEFTIFALDKNPIIKDLYRGVNSIHTYICDITDYSQIEAIRDEIKKATSFLDVIINFAGIVELGSVIEVSPEALNRTLQINLIGTYKINHAFFPFVKDSKGRIIILSSEYGKLLALPFHSFYTLSKHALEIYADSLRREVQSFGIKVIKIRPGSFKTNMVDNIQNQFAHLVTDSKLFKKPLTKMESLMIGEIKSAKDPKKIVKVFKKAIYKKHPRLSYRVHNSFKMRLLNALPAKLQDWILGRFFTN